MSRPRQPGGIVALGVINIVLGSLALLLGLCSGVLMIATEGDPAVVAQQQFLRDNLPAYDLMQWGELAIMLFQAVALLVTGIGLLNVRNWARVAAIWCAVFSLIWIVIDAAYYFAFRAPVLERFFRDNPIGPGADARFLATFTTIVQVIIWLFCITYGIILITMLSRAHVRDLYTRYEGPDAEFERYQDDQDGRYRDDDDDWYEKRRRRDDESDYR
jgi:hypothetical protein